MRLRKPSGAATATLPATTQPHRAAQRRMAPRIAPPSAGSATAAGSVQNPVANISGSNATSAPEEATRSPARARFRAGCAHSGSV